MSSVTEDRLSKAYRLIEADELGAARAILQPLLADEPENVDAWWLLAHAVTDPVEARSALDHVLQLNPDYPGAPELSESLNDVLIAAAPELEPEPVEAGPEEPAPLPPVLADIPAIPPPETVDTTADFPDFEDERPVRERRSLLPAIIAAVIVVLIVIVAAILLLGRGAPPSSGTLLPPTEVPVVGGLPTSTGTEVVIAPPVTEEATEIGTAEATPVVTEDVGLMPTVAPTEALTETPVPPTETEAPTLAPTATQEIVTPEVTVEATEGAGMMALTEQAIASVPTSSSGSTGLTDAGILDAATTPVAGDFQALTVSLAGFTLPENAILTARTDMGNSLYVSVCTRPGEQLRRDLTPVMSAIARQLRFLPAGTEAVGARMLDCQANRILLSVLVPAKDAARFAAGELSEADFAALWKPH